MLTPRRIELYELTLQLRTPLATAVGTTSHRRVLLIAMTDDDGVTGWSESVALDDSSYTAETQDTVWAAIESSLADEVLGGRFASPGDVSARLRAASADQPMAAAAVEMASWALDANRHGLSLAAHLGGTLDAIEAGTVIGFRSTHRDLEHAVASAVDAGFRRLKLKIAPGRDLDVVRTARRVAGAGVDIAVDANGTYTLDDLSSLRALDAFGLSFIEQPLPASELDASATLQASLTTPVCLDESIASRRHAAAALERGSGRIFNVKPGRVGGLTEAVAIHDLVTSAGGLAWCGGMLESGVGRAHTVALASLPGFTLPADIGPSAHYWERDLVEPPWTMTDGRIAVPYDTPGLGVAVDRTHISTSATRSLCLEPR